MSSYGHHREKEKQNPIIQNNQLFMLNNIQMKENKEDLEIDQNRIKYLFLQKGQNKVELELTTQQNCNHNKQKFEQEYMEDFIDLNQQNLDDFEQYVNQQDNNDYQEINLINNVNLGSLEYDRFIKSSDQNKNINVFSTQGLQDQYTKELLYQNYINSNSNLKYSEQIVCARESKNDRYQEQENTNSNMMNLVTKLNTHIKNKQESDHNNIPQLSSLCKKNIICSNLNGLQSTNIDNVGILSFQSSNKQNIQQLSLQSSKQQEQQCQMIDAFQNCFKQKNQRDEYQNEREQIEESTKSKNIKACMNKQQFKAIEEKSINSGSSSQRNALQEKFVSANSKINTKIIVQKKSNKIENKNCQNSIKCLQKQIYQNNQQDQDKENCKICLNQNNFFFDNSQIVSRLYQKYASSQNYYYTRDLNEILNNYRSKTAINYKDFYMLDEESEYLKRYYHKSEYPKKSKLLTEYYKFHKDIPRLFMLPETYILNSFHDKKRRFDYYKIAQMIEEENQLNPNRPPKGIVGEKPQLRTNESSEDIKQENIQKIENKQQDKRNELLLADISSFINRGQGRLNSDLSADEDESSDFKVEGDSIDGFIQAINVQIQSDQNIENQMTPICTNSQKKYEKKELSNQKIISKGLQNLQQQSQYEKQANAFINYQKKIQSHKNFKSSTNALNNNIKPSSCQKSQSISHQQFQQIQEKQKKKTSRTDVSQTIQELNIKLGEIVTSHSLIGSRVINDADDDIKQFENYELDEFLKFLSKSEMENVNKANEKNNYKVQLNQINENQNYLQSQQNKKQINITKNNQYHIQQNDMYFSKNLQQDQNIQIKTYSNNILQQNLQKQYIKQSSPKKQNEKQQLDSKQLIQNFLFEQQYQQNQLQQVCLLQQQKDSFQPQPNQEQIEQLNNNHVYSNDISINNMQTNSNIISNLSINNQQLLNQLPKQFKQCINKKMNVKTSKSEVQLLDQFRQNQDQNNDLQIIHQNEIPIKNDINQQNLSQSESIQQIQINSQNNIMKNQNQQSLQQTKKRITPQLKLDDIDYFNDNKSIQEKQQQLTGSFSVKFSNKELLNLQQIPSSVRSARDWHTSTMNNNINMKSSVDGKLQGAISQQTNPKQKQGKNSSNHYDLNKKNNQVAFSSCKQQNMKSSNLDQIFTSIASKNYPNIQTSNSFASKLETKESQLFTPRQPQIQQTVFTSSNQKNIISKQNQILLTKPPISPRDSLSSPKNITNINQQIQKENITNSTQNCNYNQDKTIFCQANIPSIQTPISLYDTNQKHLNQKTNILKKQQKNKQQSLLQQQQQSNMHYYQNTNQKIVGNSMNNSIKCSQNQIFNSTINSQAQNLNLNQLITKQGNMSHLNLKLKLDQLNFSKEKVQITSKQNQSSNQIIKEPLSQRSCSSKIIDQQTPKYNFYETFKQQLTNQAYTQIMKLDIQSVQNMNSDEQIIYPQSTKNSNSQISQNPTFNFMNKNNLSHSEKKIKPQTEINQNNNQQMISTPQQIKSNTIKQSQISPSFKNNNAKLDNNINNANINSAKEEQTNNRNQKYNDDLTNGVERVVTNNSNRKDNQFINMINNGNQNQQELKKKASSQQTTRSETNTRKNSQIKFSQDKQQQSTAITGIINGTNLNSKHVSRNSSLEINNSNVLRKKSPQLFKCQQQESKNVYNLVQKLSNNLTQSTPKQIVSARNYQTQRNQLNHFDFQKLETNQFLSQKQFQSIQPNILQPKISNNSFNINSNIQQGQFENRQVHEDIDSEIYFELNSIQQNTKSLNQNQNHIKNDNFDVVTSLSYQNSYDPTILQYNTSQNQVQQSEQFETKNIQKLLNENNQEFEQLNLHQIQQLNNQQQLQLAQNNSTRQYQQLQKQELVQQQNLPQVAKKAQNMHKYTKSDNHMNLIIETSIQKNMNSQNQIIQTPINQQSSPSMPINIIPTNNSIQKIQKNQKQTQMVNNSLPSYINPQFQQNINSTQTSPRLILNQNFQVQQGDQQQFSQQYNQNIHQNVCDQLLLKKQSLASPLSTSTTQINFQVDQLRSTNNSTNNNNSNTNNTNSQNNNNIHSGVNNNSISMNSQFNNNNNFNNNSNNSTAQQINSSLNVYNIVTNNTNINANNQFNYGSHTVSSNSNNPISIQQQSQGNVDINNNNINSQKKNNQTIQNQINGILNNQQSNAKTPSSISSSIINNSVSNNLLKITYDNAFQTNANKKTKKKSMF